jgi:hypothetical protein
MTPTATDQRLDRELAGLDLAPLLHDAEIVSSLAALTVALEDADARAAVERTLKQATPRQHKRRIRWTVIGLIAVIVGVFGGVPAAAAVELWLAHTGLYGPVTTESDNSEWIGLNASDSDKALASLYPSYLVLPDGVTKDQVISAIIRLNTASVSSGNPDNAHVIAQTTGIHETYEFLGNCVWYSAWISADEAHDQAKLAAANAGVETAANYPALAKQSPTVTTRLNVIARGAAAGNAALVKQGYAEGDCAAFAKALGK